MVKLTCHTCGKLFYRDLCQSDRKYCSRECYHESIRGKTSPKKYRIIINCDSCGIECEKIKFEINRNKNNFCSHKCFMDFRRSTRIEKKCSICGDMFKVIKGRIKALFCSYKCSGEANKGINHPNYTGYNEKLPLLKAIRTCFKYNAWRAEIFKRGNYKCNKCDSKKDIHAHHIKNLILIIRENNITTIIQALYCEELWDLKNGEVLCKKCHIKHHADLMRK